MTTEEKLNIAKTIRNETGCGLFEASFYFNKLLEALKNKPQIVMDKPNELEMTWK